MIANLIGAFMMIIAVVSVYSPMTNAIQTSTTEITGWGATLLNIIPGFFALAVLAIAVAMVYNTLRNAGLVGVPEEWEEEYKEEVKEDPNKSYREYVKERLAVERMIRNSTGWRRYLPWN